MVIPMAHSDEIMICQVAYCLTFGWAKNTSTSRQSASGFGDMFTDSAPGFEVGTRQSENQRPYIPKAGEVLYKFERRVGINLQRRPRR